MMTLQFADTTLYVPLTRLDLIQKYRSSETGPPPELKQAEQSGVVENQSAREESHGRHGRGAAEALRAA